MTASARKIRLSACIGLGLLLVLGNHQLVSLAQTLANPVLVDFFPSTNSHQNPTSTTIETIFDQPIDPASVTSATLSLRGFSSAQPAPVYQFMGNTVVISPTQSWLAGERVQVSVTDGLQNLSGQNLQQSVTRDFWIAARPSIGLYTRLSQNIPWGWPILGDLNGDGLLDLLSINNAQGAVWLNNGRSAFNNTGQMLEVNSIRDMALGDLDQDGDLDLVVAQDGQYMGRFPVAYENLVFINDGSGHFSDSGQRIGDSRTDALALGDLDGDGDLDLVCADSTRTEDNWGHDQIWFNDGAGNFSLSPQALTEPEYHRTYDVQLGDMDADGDLDILVTTGTLKYWVNAGDGSFSPGSQIFTYTGGYSLALGDLDGDGDLDLYEGTQAGVADNIWFNDGAGYLTLGATYYNPFTWRAKIGDLDGDGDLDVFLTSGVAGIHTAAVDNNITQIVYNDGNGNFTKNPQPELEATPGAHLDLGDIDGDGDIDAIVVYVKTNVWLNQKFFPSFNGPSFSFGRQGIFYAYTAALTPLDLAPPFTYTWQVSDHAPIQVVSDQFQNTQVFSWDTLGSKTVQVNIEYQDETRYLELPMEISIPVFLPQISK
ncbi:MAG: VCBS repeat-containing protein [Anaerolineales bacterium]|nr:VCBS repeat-containing protein [Anaerolineales bacterium]